MVYTLDVIENITNTLSFKSSSDFIFNENVRKFVKNSLYHRIFVGDSEKQIGILIFFE